MKHLIILLALFTSIGCSNNQKEKQNVLLDTLQEPSSITETPFDPLPEITSNISLAKKYQPKSSYSDNSEMKSDVEELENFAYISRKYRDSKDRNVILKSKELSKVAKALQIKYFPIIRKNYVALHKHTMWENNIDMKQNGSTTLELSGGIFANNKNIQDSYETIREVLELLRFKRINFRWYKGADEYTYYQISSTADGE